MLARRVSESERLLLRFGEHVAPDGGTIDAHRQVLNEHEYVWYGKLGQKLSRPRVENIIRSAYDDGLEALILASSAPKMREFYGVTVEAVRWEPLGAAESRHVPAYVYAMRDHVSAWFKVTVIRRLSEDEVAPMVVASSRTPIREALALSTSATMYVRPSNGLLTPDRGGFLSDTSVEDDWDSVGEAIFDE